MVCAYRDRKAREREWEMEKLKFLAAAFGAKVQDTPLPHASSPQKPKRSPADVIRAMGGVVKVVS